MSAGNHVAFPQIVGTPFDLTGLTKRELLAAMAMQGSLGGTAGSHLIPKNLARESVAHADALLAELAKARP